MERAKTPGLMRRMASRFAILIVCCLAFWRPALGQAMASSAYQRESLVETDRRFKENPLFADEAILRFRLVTDYQKLLKDRGEERGYHQATLSYTDTAGSEVSLPLKVMVRGNRRRDPSVCKFPPLMLNFIRKAMPEGTVFAKVNKLKLVTHCINEDYVLREFLVYKAYNVLTSQSYRVRLCQVEYVDIQGKRKTELRYAFLIEDDKEMADRNEARLIPGKVMVRMENTDQRAMASLALFQYMIGNTDWSVPFRHNIDLIAADSLAAPIPVPFDFDYSGMVATPYAQPPPELGISSVKQRLYRGLDFPENMQREAQNTFNSFRTPIYAVYRQFGPLSESSRKQSLKFLDSFYKTINDPRKFEREIVRIGKQNERNYVTVKGLK